MPKLARPDTILIYDFAVSADEVQLDSGVVGKVEAKASGKPRTEQELDVGHKVAGIISEQLVSEINAMGMPAQRAFGAPRSWGNVMVVEGQMASIDEGNQVERVAIGGHLAVAAAAGAGLHAVSEKLPGDVDAEAKRTAKGIGKQLRGYFQMQGWVAAEK